MDGVNITTMEGAGLTGGPAGILANRPYIATEGRYRGQSVIAVMGRDGKLTERPININATLRKEEWVVLDTALIEAARERLVIIDDLRAAGLTWNAGGLGTIIAEWESVSEMTDAEATMDGESTADKDRIEFDLQGVPIPVIQKPYRIGTRVLEASRTRGAALDVASAQEAGRSVARTSEKMVFYGLPNIRSDGRQLYGLLTHPDRATISLSDWSDDATTPEQIYDDVLAMIQLMETNEREFGPFNLYVPASVSFQFRRDYRDMDSRTLEQRIMATNKIGAIRTSDVLGADDVAMVAMNSSTIDLAVASDITTVQWQSGSGWTNYFQAFAAWAPRIKRRYDGQVGYLHGTWS